LEPSARNLGQNLQRFIIHLDGLSSHAAWFAALGLAVAASDFRQPINEENGERDA
jgi:hypothetical protein